MEFCYTNGERKCVWPDKCEDQHCNLCQKLIADCEYIVNWGSCNKCFDEHYQKNTDDGLISDVSPYDYGYNGRSMIKI
jgi:hypothetical protein